MTTRTVLRRRKVEAKAGLSRSTIYAYVAEGKFPKPIRLGLRAVGWFEDEVDAWLEARQRAGEVG